jgi:hypothetical protein
LSARRADPSPARTPAEVDLHSYQDELAALAGAIHEVIDWMDPDARAYGALQRDGELHPWTDEAEVIWREATGHDDWRDHDRAILLHAKAFDLERDGDAAAADYWRLALVQWARVLGDDLFWARFERGLGERMGVEVAPGIVDGVRRRLPTDLLSVHAAVVREQVATDPERARRHMSVLKAAPFDAELKDAMRRSLVQPVVDSVPRAVQTHEYEGCLEQLRVWLYVDDDNPLLIRSVLLVCRKWSEGLWNEDDWAQMGENTAVAQELCDGLNPASIPGDPTLAAEVARHYYWRAVSATRHAHGLLADSTTSGRDQIRADTSQAQRDLDHALELDPDLLVDNWYDDLGLPRPQCSRGTTRPQPRIAGESWPPIPKCHSPTFCWPRRCSPPWW